jgi:Ku protein
MSQCVSTQRHNPGEWHFIFWIVDRDNEFVNSSCRMTYEIAPEQYVEITAEELKRLEAEANQHAEIQEFVPLTQIDPIYFEKTYHVGPAKGNEKVYRLLARAMCQQARGAIAKLMMRGKEKLVLIRPHRQRPFIA